MGKNKHHTRKHFSKAEILAMCNRVARETRMCERTPYTAMPLICLYTMLESESWKQTRLANLATQINEYKEKYDNGELDRERLKKRLFDKAEFDVEFKEYTVDDITSHTKFLRWIDEKQIAPQNTINELSTEYMLFFFNALMDSGYGKDRLQRVSNKMMDILNRYVEDKLLLKEMTDALFDVGIAIEQPIDPVTQTVGSSLTMCGV